MIGQGLQSNFKRPKIWLIPFRGKVKCVFTVKEKCGLIGSSNVDDYFLWGIEAAFVVDRRGTGDIAVSYRDYSPFCDPVFGVGAAWHFLGFIHEQ